MKSSKKFQEYQSISSAQEYIQSIAEYVEPKLNNPAKINSMFVCIHYYL